MDDNAASRLCGLPLREDGFTLGGRCYWLGANGLRTARHLACIHEQCCGTPDRKWALSARPMIRDIQRWNERAVLSVIVARTKDPVLKTLAIWLRGRCRGTTGMSTVAALASHPDFHTRKEVARALKRMADWPTLARMAEEDPDERIRRLATCNPPRPVLERMAKFTRHINQVASHQAHERQ